MGCVLRTVRLVIALLAFAAWGTAAGAGVLPLRIAVLANSSAAFTTGWAVRRSARDRAALIRVLGDLSQRAEDEKRLRLVRRAR